MRGPLAVCVGGPRATLCAGTILAICAGAPRGRRLCAGSPAGGRRQGAARPGLPRLGGPARRAAVLASQHGCLAGWADLASPGEAAALVRRGARAAPRRPLRSRLSRVWGCARPGPAAAAPAPSVTLEVRLPSGGQNGARAYRRAIRRAAVHGGARAKSSPSRGARRTMARPVPAQGDLLPQGPRCAARTLTLLPSSRCRFPVARQAPRPYDPPPVAVPRAVEAPPLRGSGRSGSAGEFSTRSRPRPASLPWCAATRSCWPRPRPSSVPGPRWCPVWGR